MHTNPLALIFEFEGFIGIVLRDEWPPCTLHPWQYASGAKFQVSFLLRLLKKVDAEPPFDVYSSFSAASATDGSKLPLFAFFRNAVLCSLDHLLPSSNVPKSQSMGTAASP